MGIRLPFDEFTDKWDAGTGDAVVTCAENKEYCPDENDKKDLYSIAVWGEGVQGTVDLQIQSVSAYGCKSLPTDDETNAANDSDIEMESEEDAQMTVTTTANKSGSDGDTIAIEDFS